MLLFTHRLRYALTCCLSFSQILPTSRPWICSPCTPSTRSVASTLATVPFKLAACSPHPSSTRFSGLSRSFLSPDFPPSAPYGSFFALAQPSSSEASELPFFLPRIPTTATLAYCLRPIHRYTLPACLDDLLLFPLSLLRSAGLLSAEARHAGREPRRGLGAARGGRESRRSGASPLRSSLSSTTTASRKLLSLSLIHI